MKRTLAVLALAMWMASPAQAQYSSAKSLSSPDETYYRAEERVNDGGINALWDPDLVNPWGLTAYHGIYLWVANNGSNRSTVHKKSTLELYRDAIDLGLSTGIVGVPGGDFIISNGSESVSSEIIIATQDGDILGWNPSFYFYPYVAFNGYGNGDRFQGLAIAQNHAGNWRLYAADSFHSNVTVIDDQFKEVETFTDSSLPVGYSPFNVQTLHGKLYVAFGKKESFGDNEAVGRGLGFIDVYNPAGKKLSRLVSGGELNAPWGLAIAPDSFGPPFAGALLVGNIGDGEINAYNLQTGAYIDKLRNAKGHALRIPALRALLPTAVGTVDYSAGRTSASDGSLGIIHPIATTPPGATADSADQ